jgi:lysophospholipase L1-like esterase
MASNRRLALRLFFGAWLFACLAAGIAILELALRSGALEITLRTPTGTFVLDPVLLYRLKPGSRPDVDARGHRFDPRSGQKRDARQVLLLGDSFAFGSNVAPHQSIAAKLEQRLGPDFGVINLGVHGYGPDQSLLLLRRELGVLRPELVIVTVFPANDLSDLARNRIFSPSGDEGLIHLRERNILHETLPALWSYVPVALALSRVHQAAWLRALLNAFFRDRYDTDLLLAPDSETSKEKRLLMQGVLRAFRRDAGAAGASLLAVVLPSYQQFAEPLLSARGVPRERFFYAEDLVVELCTAEGIPSLDVHRDFLGHPSAGDLFDPKDHHLSARGYARVAALIAKAIRARGLLEMGHSGAPSAMRR